MFNSNIVIKLLNLCRWILVVTVGLGWLGGSSKKFNRIRSFWFTAVRFKPGLCFHAFLTWSDTRTRNRQLSLFYLVLLSWLINSVDKPVNHSYSPQMWMSLQLTVKYFRRFFSFTCISFNFFCRPVNVKGNSRKEQTANTNLAQRWLLQIAQSQHC